MTKIIDSDEPMDVDEAVEADIDYTRLENLGFEDGELELLFSHNEHLSFDDVVQRYLAIANDDPYQMAWNEEQAVNANFDIPGTNFDKRHIVRDTLEYYMHDYDTDNYDSDIARGLKRGLNKRSLNKRRTKYSTKKRGKRNKGRKSVTKKNKGRKSVTKKNKGRKSVTKKNKRH